MKKLFIVPLIALLVNGCQYVNCTSGNGSVSTKSYPQAAFEEFSFGISADVELIPSTKNELQITTYENVFSELDLNNSGGKLTLENKNCLSLDETIKVKVFFVSLKKIDLMGSGDVFSNEAIKADAFELNITGSGDVRLPLICKKVDATIMGSGDINLSGSCDLLKISINGSGDVRAKDLKTGASDVSINGSGDVLLGSCANSKTSINGSGSVNCEQD